MAHQFRTKAPMRTYKGHRSDYHAYKDRLAQDFHHHCGYTDCADHWLGGQRSFQIDHLRPQLMYPDKVNDYSNLVYCCSYVNRAKWDDDSPHYLDPCDVDYNKHFERDQYGFICAKPGDADAEYMVRKLSLSLSRYAIIWNLEQLEMRIDKLRDIVSSNAQYKDMLTSLLLEFYDYTKALRNNQ